MFFYSFIFITAHWLILLFLSDTNLFYLIENKYKRGTKKSFFFFFVYKDWANILHGE